MHPANPVAWGVHPQSVELIGKRDRYSKHFLRPDGLIDAIIVAGAGLHYEAATGMWEDIDTAWVSAGDDWTVQRHSLHARVDGQGIAAWQADTGQGIRWLTPAKASMFNGAARTSHGGIQWEYRMRPSGLKASAVVTQSRGFKTYDCAYQLVGGAAELTVDAAGNLRSNRFLVPRATVRGGDGQRYLCGPWRLLPGPRVAFDLDDVGIPLPYELDPTTTFNIATGTDDGAVRRRGGTYPPTGTYDYFTTDTFCYPQRSWNGSDYLVSVPVFRWDTSSIADDATVSAATAKIYCYLTTDDEGRSVVAEYYDHGADIGEEDWTSTAVSDAHAGTAISAITLNVRNDFALQNLANINLTGYTGLRFHISGGQPTGHNFCGMNTSEEVEAKRPLLEVTYSSATNVTVNAVPGEATAAAPAPAVTAIVNATAVVVAGNAEASIVTPIVTASQAATVSAVTGEATASAPSPTVTAIRHATVQAVPGEANTSALAPSVVASVDITVMAVVAEAVAGAPVPAVSTVIHVTVTAVAGEATASSPTPTVLTAQDITIAAVPGEAIAAAPVPAVTTIQNVTVQAVPGEASANAQTPAVTVVVNVTVVAVSGEAVASAPTPTVAVVQNITVMAVAGEVTASAPTPTITAIQNVTVIAVSGEVVANAPTPGVTAAQHVTVTAVPGEANVSAPTPTVTARVDVLILSVAAEATANAPTPTIATVTNVTIAAVVGTATVNAPIPTVVAIALYTISGTLAVSPRAASITITILEPSVDITPRAATVEVTP